MSKEQQSARNLVERLKKAQGARTRLDDVLDTIGTSHYAERQDLDPQNYSGLDRIAAIRKVGKIKRAIVEKTIPQIDTLKVSLERAVRADADMAELEELARDGYVDEASLADARQLYAETQQSLATSTRVESSQVEAPRPRPREKTEQEPLVKMVINLDTTEVKIDDRNVSFTEGIGFKVLTYIARKGKVSAREISALLKRLGVKSGGGFTIFSIRKRIEQDPKLPKILVTEGISKGATYYLNANVEIIGESIHAKRSREGKQVSEVEVLGQKLKIRGEMLTKFLNAIKDSVSLDLAITSDDLALAVYGKKNEHSKRLLWSLIQHARKLLKDYNLQILQPVEPQERAKGVRGRYYLAKIEDKAKKTKGEFVPFPVHPTRLAALNLMISNPNAGADQIIGLLGNMKNERPHGRPQAVNALLNAFRRLANRSYMGSILSEESATYSHILAYIGIREITNYKQFRAAQTKLRAAVLARIKVTPGEIRNAISQEEVEVNEQILSDEEAFVLIGVLRQRSALLRKYDLPEFPEEVAKSVITVLKERLAGGKVTQERILELRESAVNKVISVLGLPNLVELFFSQPEEIQEIIDYFDRVHQNKEIAEQALREILTKKIEKGWQDTKFGQVVGFWSEFEVGGVAKEVANGNANSHAISADAHEAPTSTKQVVQPVETLKATPEAQGQHLSAIERRDPKVKERVSNILNGIQRIFNLERSISGAQISSQWHIAATEMDKQEAKGYIRPKGAKRGAGKRVYDSVDVATLLYVKRFGNGINGKLVRALREIIASGIKTRLAKKA